MTKKLQYNPHHHYEKEEEEEEYKAHSRTRTASAWIQRQPARLELHKIENTADIQDNFKSFKQLQERAGCSLSFMRNYILPNINDRKRLYRPLVRYSAINEESWVKFVERLSEKFQMSTFNLCINNMFMFMTFFTKY